MPNQAVVCFRPSFCAVLQAPVMSRPGNEWPLALPARAGRKGRQEGAAILLAVKPVLATYRDLTERQERRNFERPAFPDNPARA